MIANKMDFFFKTRWRENGNVHRLRSAVENPLGHAQADGGGDFESRAAEARIEPKALGTDRSERGMLIGGDAVVAAVRGVESAALHERDALTEAVNGSVHEPRASVV